MNRRHFAKHFFSGSLFAAQGISGVFSSGLRAQQTALHSRRLVLVELSGANDGLNTLVPFANDHYHRLRPSIALDKNKVLTLNQELGLNAALRPLMSLWEQGNMAWIQGLGYPKPNRSHFQSIALWETAGDGQRARRRHGWMTHAIEHQLSRPVLDPHGISLSGDLSLFASDSGRWLSTKSAGQLKADSLPVLMSEEPAHPTLALLQARLQTLDVTLSRLNTKLAKDPEIPKFEGGAVGEQLRQVAILIASGLDTPVYRVRMPGFDTHEKQAARHPRLLGALSKGLASFSQQLKHLSEWNNTIIMTYSEFGRRAAENNSGGTDHGTAAPHLMLGGAVNGGLYGESPDLTNLTDGDPEFTMDYRALYQRALVDGLGARNHKDSLADYSDSRLESLVKNA